MIYIKWERREKIRHNKKRKWIKHWEWKWKQNVKLQAQWLSRQWKKKLWIEEI